MVGISRNRGVIKGVTITGVTITGVTTLITSSFLFSEQHSDAEKQRKKLRIFSHITDTVAIFYPRIERLKANMNMTSLRFSHMIGKSSAVSTLRIFFRPSLCNRWMIHEKVSELA
jgi:hypothetical protein